MSRVCQNDSFTRVIFLRVSSLRERDDKERFSPAREFSQTLPSFSPGYEGTENMFYFFYKIIFRLNKKKDDIRSAYTRIIQIIL